MVIDPVVTEQRLDVFGVGTDYAMFHKGLWGQAHDDTGPWDRLGGSFLSSPAAIALDGHVHVFAVGSDYAMYRQTWDGNAWLSDWERLGGKFSSAPSVVSWGAGRFDLFVRGADYTMRHRIYDKGAWATDWENPLQGSLASPPVAVSWGPNRLDVFSIDHEDATLIHAWWDGNVWSNWERAAGDKDLVFTSAPAAVSWGPDRVDVFAVGSDKSIYRVWFANETWSTPEQIAAPDVGGIASTPTVFTHAPGSLDLMAPGVNYDLWHRNWDGASWTPGPGSEQLDTVGLPSQYVFSVDYVHAHPTRSKYTDSNKMQVTLAPGNWPMTVTAKTWPLNQLTAVFDMSDGDDKGFWLKFGPVTVELCEPVVFNYTITNSSDSADDVDAVLTKLGNNLLDYATSDIIKGTESGLGVTAISVAGTAVPLVGTLVILLGSWLSGQLDKILNAKCDGVVALEQAVLFGKDLQQRVPNSKSPGGVWNSYSVATPHPGTESADGCGPTSFYTVTWSISVGESAPLPLVRTASASASGTS